MMKSKEAEGRKTRWWVMLLLVIIVIVAVLFFMRGFILERYLRNRLSVGGNSNIELLNQLNSKWQLPEGFLLEEIEVEGIAMEWINPVGERAERVILQLHGGAYTRSLKDNGTTYRRAAVKYAEISGGSVLTVDYRVAPENPYPAALEDALLAYNYLLEEGYGPESIIIAGDSAGGGLTLATALYLRDNNLPLPKALITMSAWTNLNYKRGNIPYVGEASGEDPYISPVYGDFYGFPPMLMQVGGDEFLLQDTLTVVDRAKINGVAVKSTTYHGMFHVFQMLFPKLQEANAAWDEVAEFIGDMYTKQ